MLGPAGRGSLFAGVQTSGLAVTFGALSIGEGLIYSLGKRKTDRSEVFGTILLLCGTLSLILVALLYPLLVLLGDLVFDEALGRLIPVLIGLVPAMVIEYVGLSALKGLKEFTVSNKLSIYSKLAILISLASGFFTFGASIEVALYCYLASMTLTSMALLAVIYFVCGKKIKSNFRALPEIAAFGAKVHLGTALNEAEYRLDIYILLLFLNSSAVGLYTVATVMGQILWYVSNSINTVLYPYVVSSSESSREEFSLRIIKTSFLCNLIILTSLLIFGSYFIELLYGEEFSYSYAVFVMLAPGLLFDTLSRGIFSWLKGVGQPLAQTKISVLTLGMNLALNLLLIPKFGLIGAAAASTLTYTIKAMISGYVFCKISKVEFRSIWALTDEDVKPFASLIKRKFFGAFR